MTTRAVASIVLAITGIDLMKSDDNFPTHGDGMWFCGVTYNDTKYRTVKVVGDFSSIIRSAKIISQISDTFWVSLRKNDRYLL